MIFQNGCNWRRRLISGRHGASNHARNKREMAARKKTGLDGSTVAGLAKTLP
jgi:hypothetical protein